jgi:Tetratricopeptide repeat
MRFVGVAIAPAFLFNIAQCHRQLGNKQEAIKFYRSYLRKVPDAPNAEEVRKLIASLEERDHAGADRDHVLDDDLAW